MLRDYFRSRRGLRGFIDTLERENKSLGTKLQSLERENYRGMEKTMALEFQLGAMKANLKEAQEHKHVHLHIDKHTLERLREIAGVKNV